MSPSRRKPKLKVRCKECGNICKTKHLDFDIICASCGNYAKRSSDKVRKKTEHDLKFGQREVYVVAK